MKFSVNWLKDWVAIDVDADALADRLTASGLEVDSVEPVAASFDGIVVGEITSCEKHPDADKLSVCSVDAGDGDALQVVCGAPNARIGLKAPFAMIGGHIGADFKVRKAKLRGVESHGMLCSARELGLSDDHEGLMELPADAPVGENVRHLLSLDDHSIEVELTPNRADCLGIRGLARDVSASCNAEFTPPAMEPVAAVIDDRFGVRLDAPAECPRYVGRVVRGIDPTAATPLWMVEALRRSGLRAISPVVDCTNYVMLELGQPMHAFDLAKLQGGIHVRMAEAGEQLTLLDGKEAKLDTDHLLICDDSGPVALGGIMGGLDTSVTDDTRDIFIESAWFRPDAILGKSRRLGLHTDSSHRFERGVDPSGQEAAVERITALLMDIVGGTPGPIVVTEESEYLPRPTPVGLRLQRLNRVLGSDLDGETVSSVFDRLGFDSDRDGDHWTVTAPAARFDIAIEEDLIEEVARIYGYNELPEAVPSGQLTPHTPPEAQIPVTAVAEALIAAGYSEAITYSFVDHALLQKMKLEAGALPLANPISSDMDVMRTSLLPGLLTALGRNQRRQQERVRLFEIGTVFHQADELTESTQVAGVACGSPWPEQWGIDSRVLDFHDLKGDVMQLVSLHGTDVVVSCEAGAAAWSHPGQSAVLSVGGETIGHLGAVHPGLLDSLELRGPVFAFELDFGRFQNRELPSAKEISQFPSVRRDLALLVPENVNFVDVRRTIEASAGELLENLLIFDVFKGQAVEKGYKSLAIGLILQDVSSTLNDEVVEPLMQEVIEGLASRLGARLRG